MRDKANRHPGNTQKSHRARETLPLLMMHSGVQIFCTRLAAASVICKAAVTSVRTSERIERFCREWHNLDPLGALGDRDSLHDTTPTFSPACSPDCIYTPTHAFSKYTRCHTLRPLMASDLGYPNFNKVFLRSIPLARAWRTPCTALWTYTPPGKPA